MKSSDTGIGLSQREPIDKLYTSDSPFIRWLLNRLLKKTAQLLLKINAPSLSGLDVGCGEGNFIDYLTHQKAIGFLVAIDLDYQKLSFAKQQYPDLTCLNADANALNFKKDSFDYVIASEILEHLPDPVGAIQEIKRVAKKDAFFIVSVPHEPFFRWGNLIRGKYWKRGGRTPTHVNFWTRSEFKKLIGDFVEIKKEHWFSVFPWMLYLGKIKQIPANTERRL